MKHILPLLFLGVPAAVWAFTLSGRVAEKATGEPLPLAVYHLFAEGDTLHPVVNDVADAEGRFAARVDNGSYRLKVEYAAKKTLTVPVTVAGSDVDLGTLAMDELGEELAEVTVVARKDLISSDGGTLTYDVERDPAAGTSNILEMLRRVPMVTVDGEDNVKVKGQSNFKIYINGKPDPLLSGDPSTVLKSMPASSIRKIEVITDPGAKYDAEGTAGIINIIMDKKQSVEGYTVNARLGVMTGGVNGSLYGRTKIGKVTASAQFYGYDGRIMRAHSYIGSTRVDYADDVNHTYTSRSKSLGKNDNIGGNVNLSWEVDTLNLLTFSLNYYSGHYNTTNAQQNQMSDISDGTVWSYNRDFDTRNGWNGLRPAISYQHTFPNNQLHSLTFTYQFDRSRSNYSALQHSYDFTGMEGADFPYMSTDNKWKTNDHTFQVDYSLPITDRQTFEAGGKVLLRRPTGDTDYKAGDEEVNQTPTSAYSLTQLNDLYAAYASYNASFGRFSGRVGLRWEHSRMGLRYRYQLETDYPDFTTHLNDWVPNASFTFKLTDQSNLRAAYSMRIERPYIGQLSPAVNDLTYGSLSYGNPDLKTAHANNFELKYSNYGGKFSGEAAVSYAQTNDAVGQLAFMVDGVEHSTWSNIGRSANTSLNGYLAYQITDAMEASVNSQVNYSDYRADKSIIPLHSHGWNWSAGGSYSYTTPFKLRLEAWGGYGSGGYYMQTKGSEWYYWGMSFSRSFLKNDILTLSLNVQDLLPARWKTTTVVSTPTSVTTHKSNSRNWVVGFSANIRFGNLGTDVKRTRANINNNDGVSGGSTGGK